ncbi:MAG: hypothetical protein NTZ17_12085 [Phycisphaerae bacterium]|nr:hypothetical protein [Phycisphaerae bacterium]
MRTRVFLVLSVWTLLCGPGVVVGADLYDEGVLPVLKLEFA